MSLLTDHRAGRTRSPRVAIGSVAFDPLTQVEAATFVREALARGRGGRVVAVDLDLHRRAAEHAGLRASLAGSTVVLAGSRYAVLASWIAGRKLPQRISGSDLAEALAAVCAADRRRVFLIGGAAGSPGSPSGAQRAAAVLGLRCPGLRVAGCASLPDGFHADPAAWSAVVSDAAAARPDLVLMSAGPFGQDRIADALRRALPDAWFFCCVGVMDAVHGHPSRPSLARAFAQGVYAVRLMAGTTASRAAQWRRSRIRSGSAPTQDRDR